MMMKASYDPGSPEYEALSSIPTEGGMPAPDPIEINTVTQGGDGGLQVLVDYVPGGGNAVGPFVEGQVVKVITEATNNRGSRTSAERTITLEPPIV